MNSQALTTRIAQAAALVAVAATVGVTLATPAHAQEATEFFSQNAQPVLLGDKLYLYSLPTRNADGKVQYWDVVLDLDANEKGKPNKAAMTVSERAEKIKFKQFVSGTYVEANSGRQCELVTSAFGGRQEAQMNCYNDAGAEVYTYQWYTGPIAGNVWEPEFIAAGLDTISGAEEFAWGKMTHEAAASSDTCASVGHLVSARQTGGQVSVVNYRDDTVANCSRTFNLVVE